MKMKNKIIFFILLLLVTKSTCYCAELTPQEKLQVFILYLENYTNYLDCVKEPGWYLYGLNQQQIQELHSSIQELSTRKELKAAAKIYYYGMKLGVNL